MRKLSIGTAVSRPGQRVSGVLDVARYQGKKVKIPVVITQGKQPGPTIFISGGMHGNEINGIRLCHVVLHELEPSKLKGTVIFLPVLNLSGYEARERDVVYDGKDLNRSFRKQKQMTISNRIAEALMDRVVKKCDFGMDCHDAGERTVLLPHPRIHVKKVCGTTYELGKLLGTEILLERKGDRGMLAVEANKQYGIPVLTIETGGAMILWSKFIQQSHQGINNILVHYGMLDGKIHLPHKQFIIRDIERHSYVAETSGIIRLHVKLGEKVGEGQVLAEIHDPLHEKQEVVLSKYEGVVFSRVFQAKIDAGEIIVSVLHFRKHPVHKREPKHAEMIHNEETFTKKIKSSKIFKEALKL